MSSRSICASGERRSLRLASLIRVDLGLQPIENGVAVVALSGPQRCETAGDLCGDFVLAPDLARERRTHLGGGSAFIRS